MRRNQRLAFGLLVAVVGVLLLACPCVPALAQVASPVTQSQESKNSVSDLEHLVLTLQDEGKRDELIQTLQTLIAADRAGVREETPLTLSGRIATALSSSWTATREALIDLGRQASPSLQQLSALPSAFADPARRERNVHATLAFLGVFLVGWLAEAACWKLLIRARRSVRIIGSTTPLAKTWRTVARILLDLITIAVFAAAAFGMVLVLSPPPAAQVMALHFVNAYVVSRALLALARAILAPVVTRVVAVSQTESKNLYRWVRRFVVVGVGGYFVIAAILLLGFPRQTANLLFNALYVVLAALAIVMILQYRQKVASGIRQLASAGSRWHPLAPLLAPLASIWHILAILYVLGFFAVSAFDIENGFAFMARGTMATLGAILLVALAASILSRSEPSPVPSAVSPASPSLAGRLAAYTPALRWAGAAALAAGAILLACQGWGLGAFEWVMGTGGQRVSGAVVSITLTLAIAVVAWESASSAIQRFTETGARGILGARRRTLLPLLQKTLFAFLTVMVVLITLSEIGINIAPLLAGAGVAGLAIGFGAQRLVQDVITGFFMLVEDAVAVGDIVSVGNASGVVEDMSVRALKLRDAAGTLHTVPFSAVSIVSNMTKNFSYYVLDIGVAYESDPDKVASVCTAIIDEMRQESAYASFILEPLEVMGLDSFGDSAIVIKARIKTVPAKQWFVGREYNRRMKQRFDALGIEFPYPHRTIYFGREGDEPAPMTA